MGEERRERRWVGEGLESRFFRAAYNNSGDLSIFDDHHNMQHYMATPQSHTSM